MVELLKSILSDKSKVLILGFGREGRSSYRTIRKYFPVMKLGVADSNLLLSDDELICNDKNLELYLGSDYLNSLAEFDIIIKSPGVKLGNLISKFGDKITSQTDLFLQCYADQVIGVTGTKGKSTTVSLIKHFLDAAGKDAILLGNIGVPAFDMIEHIAEGTTIVYELSAHQLEYLHRSPHISILLNVFPEHLDYFESLKEYTKAKNNIYKFQNSNDVIIVSDRLVDALSIHEQKVIPVTMGVNQIKIIDCPLLGIHNLFNVECALLAVAEVGVEVVVALDSLKDFKNLPHRLDYIGSYGGIQFINDSISTVPESTIAAVVALNNVDTLILGGFDRGLDYNDLVVFLINSSVRNIIFLGEAGRRIHGLMEPNNLKRLFLVDNIDNVFKIISRYSNEINVCLLSPAASSYDQFRNFEHRGDKFTSLASSFGDSNKNSA